MARRWIEASVEGWILTRNITRTGRSLGLPSVSSGASLPLSRPLPPPLPKHSSERFSHGAGAADHGLVADQRGNVRSDLALVYNAFAMRLLRLGNILFSSSSENGPAVP
jgi:hypothetical protein